MTIGFIGLGNMAKALMGGIISKGIFDPQDIIGSDPMEAARESAAKKFGIQTRDNNSDVAISTLGLFTYINTVYKRKEYN